MVTVPKQNPTGPDPPYPTTPIPSRPLPAGQPLPTPQPQHNGPPRPDDDDEWERSDSDSDEWEMADKPDELPKALQVGRPDAAPQPKAGLPASLRVGPPAAALRKPPDTLQAVASEISLPVSSGYSSTISLPQNAPTPVPQPLPPLTAPNPFLQKQTTGQAIFGGQPRPAWNGANASPATYQDEPAELPAVHTPTDDMPGMRLSHSPQSTQPPLIPVEAENPRAEYDRHDSTASSHWDPGMDISSLDAFSSRGHRLPPQEATPPARTWQEQQDWDRSERERRQLEAEAALARAQREELLRHAEDEWHRGEAEHRARQMAGQSPITPIRRDTDDDTPPPPPPALRPPPPKIVTTQSVPRSILRSHPPEHYSIKQIRWFDASCDKVRGSPILTQNANGPCPLLALVNALVLSTPEGAGSGLLDTLRTREQVSLTLLLDAVFDELMSGRRGRSAEEIPDVGELYEFLKNLHSGMNVNPKFTFSSRRGSRDTHPTLRQTAGPGEFENTREMKLYSTFHVPLVHGWLPSRDEAVYSAFARNAPTYEDAQNVQFREEELEDKLDSAAGLTLREQELFEDLAAIKSFLQVWPTQLTQHGLKVLHEHLPPGGFAILFRNDHFSTLYKEPKADQLMTLVTDAGYASHDEIIWESLVDVNGQGSELFSGDFRPVSHDAVAVTALPGPPPGPPPGSSSGAPVGPRSSSLGPDSTGEGEWSTAGGRRGRSGGARRRNTNNNTPSPPSSLPIAPARRSSAAAAAADDDAAFAPLGVAVSRTEQEDHDLALALQLQEEEEAQARRAVEERARADRLSSQLLEGEGRVRVAVAAPTAPGSNATLGGGSGAPATRRPPPAVAVRPPPPRRAGGGDEGAEPPPPSYEQAAAGPAFVPPAGHPASPSAPRPGAAGGGPRPEAGGRALAVPMGGGGGQGYRQAPWRASAGGGVPLPGGRRASVLPLSRDERDKCVVM